MNKIILLLRSFRLLNVFSMLFLLMGLRFYFWKHFVSQGSCDFEKTNSEFFLLLLTVALISAGGYLVNDIFDIEVDKVNKPTKNLAYSKPNLWLIYICLNVSAVILTFLFFTNNITHYILIGTIILLFLYSCVFQKLPLLGNLTIAILSFFLPIVYLSFDILIKSIEFENPGLFMAFLILGYSCFAFFITLLRELVKDIEDIKGDFHSNYKTFPVLFGVKKSKVLFYFIMIFSVVGMVVLGNGLFTRFLYEIYGYYIPTFILLLLSVLEVYHSNFSKASLLLKFALFSGVLILFIL